MNALWLTLLFSVVVNGYEWKRIYDGSKMPDNMVVHTSLTEGLQGVCRSPGWASGRLKSMSQCIIPSGTKEHTISPPFDVLVGNPLTEKMYWRLISSAEDIMKNGVKVKPPHYPEPHMYVCAVTKWGPGKVVIWAENEIICYVSHKGKEHRFKDNFLVLVPAQAEQYELSKVEYFLDDIHITENSPKAMAQATLRNDDTEAHFMSYELSYEMTHARSWSNSVGYKTGTSMTVSAGIPALVNMKWKISTEMKTDYTFGKSYSEKITKRQTVDIAVPAKHSCKVQMVARETVVDVPYQALATNHFPDGTSHSEIITGVYDGIDYSDDTMEILGCEPL